MIPGSPATVTLRTRLARLGECGADGALHVGGRPGGVLYLSGGRITYAVTPVSAGLGERLVASGRLSADAWAGAVAEGHRRALLRDGLIGRHELALRVAAVICDATHALLQSAAAPVRFVPRERHWLGELAAIEVRRVPLPGLRIRPRDGGSRMWTKPVEEDAQPVRLVAARSPQDGPR